MSNFAYRAIDSQGAALDGTLEAIDEEAVIDNLSKLGYKVVSIQEQKALLKDWIASIRRSRRVSPQEILLFLRQVSTMLKAGLPLTATLFSVSQQVENHILREAIDIVLKDINGGVSFSDALAKHPKIFDIQHNNL